MLVTDLQLQCWLQWLQTNGGSSSFVVDQSPGRAREQGWIVAGVVEETRTLTSKFVLDVYTLTH